MMNIKKLLLMLLLCVFLIPTAIAHADCDEYRDVDKKWMFVNKTIDTNQCIDSNWYVGKYVRSDEVGCPAVDGRLTIPGVFSTAEGTKTQNNKVLSNQPVIGIDNDAFYFYDTKLDGKCPITSVTIPGSIRVIDERAFQGTDLTSVDIPASVETIKSNAFHHCASLKSVTFRIDGDGNSNIDFIAMEAFCNAKNLTLIQFEGYPEEHIVIIPKNDEQWEDTGLKIADGAFGWNRSEEEKDYLNKDTEYTRVILFNDQDTYRSVMKIEVWNTDPDEPTKDPVTKAFGIADRSQVAVPLPDTIQVAVNNDATYTGDELTPTVVVEGMQPQPSASDIRFAFYKDGKPVYDEAGNLAQSLTNAGTYTLDIFIKENTEQNIQHNTEQIDSEQSIPLNYYTKSEWTISKAKQSDLSVTIAEKNIIWGQTPAPQLVGDKKSSGAVSFEYSSDGTNWSTAAPKEPGSYQVRAVIAGDDNWEEFVTAPEGFTISKAEQSGLSVTIAGPIAFGETPAPQLVGDKKSSGAVSFEYSSDGTSWSTAAPKEPGSYQVRAVIAEDAHYNKFTTAAKEFTISKEDQPEGELSVTIAENIAYGETPAPQLVGTPKSSGAVSFEYSSDGTNWSTDIPTEPGSYQVRAMIAEDAHYSKFITASVGFVIDPKPEEMVFYRLLLSEDLPTTGFPTK